jgi:hypothetical protein
MTGSDLKTELVLDGFFRGPATSANGGYAAGAAAALLGEAAEVRLLSPPPIDRPLAIRRNHEGIHILDRETVVLTARPRGSLDIELPDVDLVAARNAAATRERLDAHAAPTCVVCGPAREEGLRIFPGTLNATTVATSWTAPAIGCDRGEPLPTPVIWAALDCPGGWSFPGAGTDFFPALISQSVDIIQPVQAGTEVLVIGWETSREDRKLHASTAILDMHGQPLAVCRQTCAAVPLAWAQ